MARRGAGRLQDVAAMMAGAEIVPIGGADAAGPAGEALAPAAGGAFPGDDQAAKVERPTIGGRRRKGPAEPELPMLPSGCPVICLGKRGQTYFFLDQLGELVSLAADKVAQKGILSLFGRHAYLVREFWPRFGKPDKTGHAEINGWKVDVASELLMSACAAEGVFDPVGRVRGRGAHLHIDGALILHCGDKLLIGAGTDQLGDGTPRPRVAKWHDPGRIGGFVYPTGPSAPRPATEAADACGAAEILGMLETWRWKRSIDPVLLLGWIGAAMLGGALAWRPNVWVTGDSATGKSTLQAMLEDLFDGGLVQSADASEAGVRQVLGQDTLPVALDEAEAEENSHKINSLVKLARLSTSGTMGLRGGADHKGHQFAIRCCFLFSSVLMPAMLPQDRNRLAILELLQLEDGARPPVRDRAHLKQIGRQLRRRLFDGWGGFESRLEDYRQALGRHGHAGRGADVFGTLLACADLLLGDSGDEGVELWARQLAADQLMELSDEMSNAARCVQHLSSSALPPVAGKAPMSVGRWCLVALIGDEMSAAKDRLGGAGMRVVQRRTREDGKEGFGDPGPDVELPRRLAGSAPIDDLFLAVATTHRGLDPIFHGTPWQGRAGAAGGWGQALRRIKGHIANAKAVRIDGKTQACTMVPLAALVDLGKEAEE